MALKITDVLPGQYKIVSYEKKLSKFGYCFILTTDLNEKNWSNRFITDYILTENPKRKFDILMNEDKKTVTIPGYSRVVELI
jgi:hypothetical protein